VEGGGIMQQKILGEKALFAGFEKW